MCSAVCDLIGLNRYPFLRLVSVVLIIIVNYSLLILVAVATTEAVSTVVVGTALLTGFLSKAQGRKVDWLVW